VDGAILGHDRNAVLAEVGWGFWELFQDGGPARFDQALLVAGHQADGSCQGGWGGGCHRGRWQRIGHGLSQCLGVGEAVGGVLLHPFENDPFHRFG
jgi:hypothetical protein